MNKLEINLKAAKMLGRNPTTHEGAAITYDLTKPVIDASCVEFNLFTNPADTLAVVKHLGEKHDVTVYRFKDGWAAGYHDIPYVQEEWYTDTFPEYNDAVGAAVEAINE